MRSCDSDSMTSDGVIPLSRRGTEILHCDEIRIVSDLEACFDEQLLEERVPDLDGGPLALRFLAQLHRGEARAGDTVAAGLRPDQQHGIARAASPRRE